MPDLRFHPEFRRGYAICLDDLQKLRAAAPQPEADTQGVAASEDEVDADDAADILRNLIIGIEKHGMYSKESTLMSLQQAYSALRPANEDHATPGAQHGK